MSVYKELNKDFVHSIQTGNIDLFIERLNESLQKDPFNQLAWLFVSRAYTAKGDIQNATNSYTHFLRISDPNKPADLFKEEITNFALRHGKPELSKFLQDKFDIENGIPPKKINHQLKQDEIPLKKPVSESSSNHLSPEKKCH